MRAMVLRSAGSGLSELEVPVPALGPDDVLIDVEACGICRTDLHILDGELREPKLPLILGHQIVGRVLETASAASNFPAGTRVGVPWLASTCGYCRYCTSGRENLCDHARFTGYHRDGGFAELAAADERFCFALPDDYPAEQLAPLLCAGMIGGRALGMAGDAKRLGLYGVGAAAHILLQVAAHEGREVYAFTRDGDEAAQAFARRLGARWAGASTERPPVELDAAIIFAPVGALVPAALQAVRKGGRVVCGGIHMSDIPSFPYSDLWGERVICSVANLTRADATEFLRIAPQVPVRTTVQTFPLEAANEALAALREGRLIGAAVLVP
jgi:propanol-preferring alcohol dehydrogenase